MAQEWRQGEYSISTDKRLLDLSAIHSFLTTSYWAKGIPFETVKKSIEHSLNFGVYKEGNQVGFARVITDYATYAYIGDVYILEDYRGQGLSKWLMQVIADHSELQACENGHCLQGMRMGCIGELGLPSLKILSVTWRKLIRVCIKPGMFDPVKCAELSRLIIKYPHELFYLQAHW